MKELVGDKQLLEFVTQWTAVVGELSEHVENEGMNDEQRERASAKRRMSTRASVVSIDSLRGSSGVFM